MKLFSIRRYWILPVLFLTFLIAGCCFFEPATRCGEEERQLLPPVDYASSANWVLLPAQADKAVDLFYIYPTLFADSDHLYMDWSSAELREKAVNISSQQTGPFATGCNIYAPFVRQAELGRALRNFPEDPRRLRQGAEDTVEAFRYYLKHHNRGRPFILAGHSQGAFDLLELMKKEFNAPDLQARMIAAYLPGLPISRDLFNQYPFLKPASGPVDLGVIISWNTQAPETVTTPFSGQPGTYCINPLNWRTDAVPAPAAANYGALFFDGENQITAEIPAFCDAAVNPETGALVVTPAFPGKYDSHLLGAGVYHMNDIYFFYRNIEANARDRITRYFTLKENQQ